MQLEERHRSIPWWVADCIADTSTDILAITGGLGSAKTTGSALFFLDRWLLNRGSQFSWAVAPTHTKIEQILLPAIRFVLHEFFGMEEDLHYRIYKGRFFKLVCRGYLHEIHFLSGDRPGLFVGSNIACLWITEPGLMEREVFEKGQTRLRCPRAEVRQVICEGTPEGVSGKGAWWAELANVPGVGYDRRGTEGLQKNVRRFIVETTFNKHLKPSPEEYAQKKIRDVFAYDKNKILSYEKGLFVSFTKGSAYWEWVESRNLIAPIPATEHVPLDLCFDFNVDPLAFVVGQDRVMQKNYYSPRMQQFIALSESDGEARGLMDAVADFASQYPVNKFGSTLIRVFGDASGWARNHQSGASDYSHIEQYLRALGYSRVEIHAGKHNPSIRHRLEVTAALMVYEKFMVTSNCKKLIAGFVKTALKEGQWDIEKPDKDTWTHYPDAVTYRLFQEAKDLEVTRPGARRIIGATM